MILPVISNFYDPKREAERQRVLEEADARNFKRGADLDLVSEKLILTNGLGVRYRIVIDDAGDLGVELV